MRIRSAHRLGVSALVVALLGGGAGACQDAPKPAPLKAELAPDVVAAARRIAALEASEHAPPPRPVHVRHYSLKLAVDLDQPSLEGSAELSLQVTGAARRTRELDSDELAVKSVADAKGAALPFKLEGARLVIDCGRDVSAGEEVKLAIGYSAKPRRGLVFVGPDAVEPNLPRMAWTQGEC